MDDLETPAHRILGEDEVRKPSALENDHNRQKNQNLLTRATVDPCNHSPQFRTRREQEVYTMWHKSFRSPENRPEMPSLGLETTGPAHRKHQPQHHHTPCEQIERTSPASHKTVTASGRRSGPFHSHPLPTLKRSNVATQRRPRDRWIARGVNAGMWSMIVTGGSL